jgi:hypothetical protein
MAAALAVDTEAGLYVSEWLLGGRYHKVTRLSTQPAGHGRIVHGAERRRRT